MNQFAEKYKTLSNAELLKIINHPGDYQPLAVEAAQAELDGRHLTETELAETEAENQQQENDNKVRAEKREAFENKLKNAGSSFVETIHPVQQSPVSLNRVILLVSIVFGIMGIVQLWNFGYYGLFFSRHNYSLPIRVFAPNLFQGVYLVLTALLFWRKGKWGWIFLSIYLCFSAFGSLSFLVVEIWRGMARLHIGDRFWLDNLSSVPFTLLFYGCCIWFIYRRSIREVYTIDKPLAIITAAVGAFLALLMIVLIVG